MLAQRGFHSFPDWESRIIKSVIESFFVAIHNGRLIVKVGKTTLNSTNLRDHIRKRYAEPDPQYFADEYYEALTSEESAVYSEDDFRGLGGIRLQVLENKDFKKKVAMFRRSGMKIFDKGHFQTPLRFSGVFTVEGAELDAVLRTLEPPSHDDWLWERGDDPAQAKRLLHELRGWINEKVHQLVSSEDLSEVDAEGISDYLPDELEDSSNGSPIESTTATSLCAPRSTTRRPSVGRRSTLLPAGVFRQQPSSPATPTFTNSIASLRS